MIHRICHIRQVIEAFTPRWTFEGGMRDAAHEALAILRHEDDDQLEHSQYRHFLSHVQEGVEVVVLPTEGHDRIGCFADQVKLTRALVRYLNEAIKEVKLLGEHGEEASQKITELEALCKKVREDAQKLREEKTMLEGIVESHDELIMDFVDTYGYNRSDEDAKDEDEDEDEYNGGDATAPLATVPHPTPVPPAVVPTSIPTPPAAAPEVIIIDEEDLVEMVPELEAPEAHDVILVDGETKLLQPHLFNVLVRDHEESPSRMMDDLDDLNDLTEADYDVDEWFPMDGSNDRD
jgi:hypothetical protein